LVSVVNLSSGKRDRGNPWRTLREKWGKKGRAECDRLPTPGGPVGRGEEKSNEPFSGNRGATLGKKKKRGGGAGKNMRRGWKNKTQHAPETDANTEMEKGKKKMEGRLEKVR